MHMIFWFGYFLAKFLCHLVCIIYFGFFDGKKLRTNIMQMKCILDDSLARQEQAILNLIDQQNSVRKLQLKKLVLD